MRSGEFVRDDSGDMVSEIDHLGSASLGEGSYILELSTQIKTYVEVHGGTITCDGEPGYIGILWDRSD